MQSRFDGVSPFYDTRTKETHPPFPQHPITQYSRCTVILDDNSLGKQGHGFISSNLTSALTYDLLAVCPTTDATFSAACTSLSELKPISIDIISLDLAAAPRLPFMLKRSSVGAAIQNGVMFEVCYGAVTGVRDVFANHRASSFSSSRPMEPNEKARARRCVIAGTRELLRVTNGKNILLSSGAAQLVGLRGPADVANLASVMGLNQELASDAMTKNARSIIKRAETRRTWRGIVGPPKVRILPAAKPAAIPGTSDSITGNSYVPDPSVDMGVINQKKRPREEEPASTQRQKRQQV